MSNKAVNWAREIKTGSSSAKFVLWYLADRADDLGRCYPRIDHMAEETEMNRKTVMLAIQNLCEKNIVFADKLRGRNTFYTLNFEYKAVPDLEPLIQCQPVPDQALENDQETAKAVPDLGLEQDFAGVPKTALQEYQIRDLSSTKLGTLTINNHQEPLKDIRTPPKKTRHKKSTPKKQPVETLDYSSWPNMPSEQIFNDWKATRKAKRAQINQTVINAFGKSLTEAAKLGFTVDQCLTECITRNWQGFQAEWLKSSNVTKFQPRRTSVQTTGFADNDYSNAAEQLGFKSEI